ncbi:MAG: MBL fold metallo-hydrolase [Bacteroidales bacterium]|jgi:beta-lactamase superfamily II metal-dependent hydrolase|nr:MBL fold metallo-hydrolase [Bacteroidales bacterium]
MNVAVNMELRLLQANNGDAIHLKIKDEEAKFRNILIDGGTGDTYTYKNHKSKIQDGALKSLIEQIRIRHEYIDLLILTHVDDDHIGGILKWFEQDLQAKDLVKKVWFNSGRLISEYFQQEEIPENLLTIGNHHSYNTSISQGVVFEDFIEENNIWDRRIIKSGDEINLFGIKFTILSPSENQLKKLLTKWGKEAPVADTSRVNNYSISLSQLVASDSFREDNSIHNGSSIAFILEYQAQKILLLGDAHPQTIIDSLTNMGYSSQNPVRVDFVKLSHHGSKANTNNELLNLIQSENFLISSNGSSHNLPDKQCLARIINCKKNVNLHFNYPELATQIFSEQDFKNFPNFSVCDVQKPIEI